MAEGGVEEMAKAYQTATEKMCEICLDVEEMPPVIPQSTEELSDELRTPMCTTHKLPIQLYCEDHNQVVCDTCKLMDHRKCKHLRDLEHVITENKGKSSEVLQHLEDIDRGLSKTEDAITTESQAMEEQKEQLIQKIRSKMQETEALGQKKISEVEKIFVKEQKCLQEENDGIKQTHLLVSKSIEEIKTAIRTCSKEELFIETTHAEKESEQYQDILNDTNPVTHREVKLDVDRRRNGDDYFGKIELKECKLYVDLEPRTVEYLNTKSSLPIYWFDVLPGDKVLVLHHDYVRKQHDHLSLYSRSTGLLSQLDLPGAAMSADTLNDHQVIVAISDKKRLLMVEIANNKVVQKDTIQTKGHPLLILKYSDQSVIVLVQQKNGKYCLKILDLRGNEQTNRPINENLNKPWFMRIDNDRYIILITDSTNGCYGFNLQGNTRFHFTQPNVEQYSGLAVDHNNCVYIHLRDQENRPLIKLSPTGKLLQRMSCGVAYPLSYARIKLYVAVKNAQNELMICYIYT